MASKTRMTALVRAFDWRAAAADLDARPDLLAYKDERGRNWLHIGASANVQEKGRSAAESVKTAEMLLDRGFDVNEPSFTEGAWKATPSRKRAAPP